MILGTPFRGNLFAEDCLRETIAGTRDWQAIDDTTVNGLEACLREVFARFGRSARISLRRRG